MALYDRKTLNSSGIEYVIDYFHKLDSDLKEMEKAKEIAKDAIIARMKKFHKDSMITESGLEARVTHSKGKTHINVGEARDILDEKTFKKLAKRGKSFTTLAVRKVKNGK